MTPVLPAETLGFLQNLQKITFLCRRVKRFDADCSCRKQNTLRPDGANTIHRGRDRPTRNTLQTMTTISNLISALIIVESSGNDQAIGDNGRALGPLQIHRGVVLDVNRITGSNYRWESMTNRAQARAVCEAYLKTYGKGASTEQLARRWNGGPTGDRKSATEAYWAKVKKHLK